MDISNEQKSILLLQTETSDFYGKGSGKTKKVLTIHESRQHNRQQGGVKRRAEGI